jgi:hypothetical protein
MACAFGVKVVLAYMCGVGVVKYVLTPVRWTPYCRMTVCYILHPVRCTVHVSIAAGPEIFIPIWAPSGFM